jgi:hypothetical protein
VVATGEHAAAFGSSLLSVFIPFLVAALVIVLVIFIIVKFRERLFSRRRA